MRRFLRIAAAPDARRRRGGEGANSVEEMHAFSAALKSPEAHAAFLAFLSGARKIIWRRAG
jgi:hypothetical protein